MATETKIERPRMSVIEIMRTPEFQTLSEKQSIFVARYISGGFLTGRYDATDAAATAYRTKNPVVLGAELIGQSKIKRVLDLHFRRSGLESILTDLRRAAKKSAKRGITSETVRALAAFDKYVAKENSNG
jgi:hypothetical protein